MLSKLAEIDALIFIDYCKINENDVPKLTRLLIKCTKILGLFAQKNRQLKNLYRTWRPSATIIKKY